MPSPVMRPKDTVAAPVVMEHLVSRGSSSISWPTLCRNGGLSGQEFFTPNIQREGIPGARMKKGSVATAVSCN